MSQMRKTAESMSKSGFNSQHRSLSWFGFWTWSRSGWRLMSWSESWSRSRNWSGR
jgi:hypothetical protein